MDTCSRCKRTGPKGFSKVYLGDVTIKGIKKKNYTLVVCKSVTACDKRKAAYKKSHKTMALSTDIAANKIKFVAVGDYDKTYMDFYHKLAAKKASGTYAYQGWNTPESVTYSWDTTAWSQPDADPVADIKQVQKMYEQSYTAPNPMDALKEAFISFGEQIDAYTEKLNTKPLLTAYSIDVPITSMDPEVLKMITGDFEK